jgi:hypothetical protein
MESGTVSAPAREAEALAKSVDYRRFVAFGVAVLRRLGVRFLEMAFSGVEGPENAPCRVLQRRWPIPVG